MRYWRRALAGVILLVLAGGLIREMARVGLMSGRLRAQAANSVVALPVMVAPGPSENWEPQVAIVWPHDGAGNATSVTGARAVNVSVWPRNYVGCSTIPLTLRLYVARNNNPARQVPVEGRRVMRTVNGSTFPSIEFNDIPVESATDPNVQYRFYVDAEGGPLVPERVSQRFSNLWVHAADARTVQPQPVRPVGFTQGAAGGPYDAWIQIVFPHDAAGQPASTESAPFVNVAADVFARSNQAPYNSVPYDAMPALDLLVAEENQSFRPALGVVAKEGYPLGDQSSVLVPRAVFNDVPARPGKAMQFMVVERQGRALSSVWTHAADARTYLPEPSVPPPCSNSGPPTPTPLPPTATPRASATPVPPTNGDFEQTIANMINQERTRNGLGTLSVQAELNQAARRHSNDMATNNITSHTGSDGSTAGQRMRDAGYEWVRSGEMIGWGFSDPGRMMQWWMNSPTHRQLILSSAYEDYGISYVFNANSVWKHYWTVDFGRRGTPGVAEGGELHTCVYTEEGTDGGSGVIFYSEEPCP